MDESKAEQSNKSTENNSEVTKSQQIKPELKPSFAEKVWSDVRKATLYVTIGALSFFAGSGLLHQQTTSPPDKPPIEQPATQNQDQELTKKVTEAVDALQQLPKTTDAKEQEHLRRKVEDAAKALNEAEAKRPSPLVAQLKQLFIAVGTLVLTTAAQESIKAFMKRILDSLKSTKPTPVPPSPEQSNSRHTNHELLCKFNFGFNAITA